MDIFKKPVVPLSLMRLEMFDFITNAPNIAKEQTEALCQTLKSHQYAFIFLGSCGGSQQCCFRRSQICHVF